MGQSREGNALLAFFIITLLSSTFTGVVGATSQTSRILSSSGTIVSASPSPTPTLSPSPTLTPSPSPSPSPGAMQFSGLGTDYLLYFNSGSPEQWISSGVINDLAEYRSRGFYASRLSFKFNNVPTVSGASMLDYTKFDRVLQIFNSVGVKAIPCAWDDQSQNSAFLSSYQQNWVAFATRFKDDNRIAAFNIGNEPSESILGGSINTRLKYWQLVASIIDAIHVVDSDRICIVPYPYIFSSYGISFSSWYSDLQAAGLVNKPYTMFDVCHSYFMENQYDMGMTPEQKATWAGNNQIAPAVQAFGASRCWFGETFPWLGEATSGTQSLQLRWTTAIINECVRYSVSFTLWCAIGNSAKWPTTEQAIGACNYAP